MTRPSFTCVSRCLRPKSLYETTVVFVPLSRKLILKVSKYTKFVIRYQNVVSA